MALIHRFTASHLYLFALMLSGLLCLLLASSVYAQLPAPRLSVDSKVASAGYYQLSWEADSLHAELQEAADPGFQDAKTVYLGADRATVVSGRPDGTWYYRIRSIEDGEPGIWSSPLSVEVSHHSLERAAGFFALGVFIFLGILIMVVRGARASEEHTR